MIPLRILLVEDHDESRLALERLLHMSGHSASLATCAADARSLAASEVFNVLLIDLGLPDGSGIDLLRDLRANSAAPALALTAFGEEWFADSCVEAGFCGWLVKPVVFDDLLHAIESAAGGPARPLNPAPPTSGRSCGI
ncbi:MAG: hybrid sensor histidine kinase/response regulator [Phycisphaerales bacterium]|jgi:DNA-binding response OmpR family regulator|nr:hybrid sensor histidine kinase/response regulator [Phycisphaerales bacterium]MDB5354551.1 hybrid sensor histidine kinase/response regulator [Phycisphaerales bacterium]